MLNAFLQLSPVWRMAAIVLAVLILASAVTIALRLALPKKNLSELSSRVRSWWLMAALFFGAVLVRNRASLVFFAFLSFWALKEYITLLKTRPADHRALVLTFLAIPVQYYWIATDWYGMFIIFIPVFMFLVLPAQLMLSKDTRGFVSSASQIQWGLMAFVFGLSHLGQLLTRGHPIGNDIVEGRSMLLFLVFVVEMNDVLKYAWGKTLGRHKIIPAVSPNKTWEGFVGGTISVALLSLTIRFLTPFAVLETVMVAVMIAVAGSAGGAVMSAIKRDFGVKDFGTLIPGHGGMVDRVDSLCYAAPIFFHYVRYYYY
ncbi:MAG TPA: phosphatidate cytidylyltransferase [Blastocatellia bacterium]|nr:phosphatidate cytidylyltransferase [Blastocatellia bacterium]